MNEIENRWMTSAAAEQVRLISCRHGWFHVLDTDTVVGRSLIDYGEWTEAECALLVSYLRPGDNVIDVGAHVGAHSVPLARAIAPGGALLAFEPQGLLFDLLAANLSRNGVRNARLHNVGCGESCFTGAFPAPDYGECTNFGALSFAAHATPNAAACDAVQIVSIDDFCDLDQLRLIKIDVEGMELDVLRGAQRTIQRFRPILYVENENPARSEPLLQWLTEAGYYLYWHPVPLFRRDNFNGESRNVFGSANCINVLCMPTGIRPCWPSLQPVSDRRDHPRLAIARKADALNRKAADLMVRRAHDAEARGDATAAASFHAKARELLSKVDGPAP